MSNNAQLHWESAEMPVLCQAAPPEVSELEIHSGVSHAERQREETEAGGQRQGAGADPGSRGHTSAPQDSSSQGAPETECGLGRKYFERQKHV